MRLIFPDDPSVPITDVDAVALMNQASDWYVEKSYGAVSITSDVTPLLMMPQNKLWYRFEPLRTLLEHARAAAMERGYHTNDYDLDIARFTPISGLNFSGTAITRGKGLWLQSSHPGVVIHELGHNFGLEHANFWAAGGDSIIGPGVNVEYGNIFDIMGQPPSNPGDYHFNVCWLNRLGWLSNGSVATISTSGVYRLHAFDVASLTSGQTYALKIRKDQSRDYWAEFRQKFPSNPWTQNGILLNWSPWANSRFGTDLLDTTPGSPDGTNDSPLVVGRTLSDLQAGIHITPLSVSDTGSSRSIDVQVYFGFFSNNIAPSLTLAADRTNVGVGQPVQFTASANDPDGDSLAYHWDFGDLSLGSNATTVLKSWQQPGEYAVRCTVSDMKGGIAIRNVVITVGSPTVFQISGRIVDGAGNAVRGVRAHNSATGSAYRSAYTDSDGYYSLVNLPAGSHTLVAVKYGYNFATTGWANPVSVGPDAAISRDWTASPSPPVSVVATDSSATESEAGSDTAAFTITRSGSLDVPLSVKFNLEGTAELWDDYTLSAGGSTWPYTVVLPVGVSSTNIIVRPGDEFQREGTEVVVLTLIEDAGYIIYTNSASVAIEDSIGRILPYIEWDQPSPITYGTSLGANQLNAFTFDDGTLTYDPPAGTTLNAGTAQQLKVIFTPDDPLRYESVTNDVSIDVFKAPLTVKADDLSIVYGAPIVLTASYSGFVNGDSPTALDTPVSITTDAVPGSPAALYPITLSGGGDANYSLTLNPGNLTITRATTAATLTSSPNPALQGQEVVFTCAVAAVLPSMATPIGTVRFFIDGSVYDAVSLVNGVASVRTSGLSLGVHSVLAEYLGTANFSGTIKVLDPDQNIVAPPAITWPTPTNIVYGTVLGPVQLNASCSVPGTFVYDPPAGTMLNAGQGQVLSVAFTPSDSALPALTTNVTINVLKRTLTVTARDQTKIYGAPLPSLELTYAGFVHGETVAGLDSLPSTVTAATAASPVGSYPITISGGSDSDYIFNVVDGTLSVTPAPLTIRAVNTNTVYGAPLPLFSATYTGLVNDDIPENLDTPVAFNTMATLASNVGTYVIEPYGATDSNYTIQFVNGILEVGQANSAAQLISSLNPALPGQQVTFTVTAHPVPPSVATPSGVVSFKIGTLTEDVPLTDGVATFSTSALSVGAHVVEVEYPGNTNWLRTTNRLVPNQLVNTPPVATADTVERRLPNGAKVLISALLANDFDSDGDAIEFLSFAPVSANGGTITREGNWIYYAAPAGFTNDDSFTYTITDGRGQSVVGIVNVRINSDPAPPPNLAIASLGNGSYRIRFDGVAGVSYRIEWSTLNPATWETLGNITIEDVGSAEIVDAPPVGTPRRFYRCVSP
jgi:hypothetical protein